MGRSPCCCEVGLRRGAWSVTEDRLLTHYVQAHGESHWKSLPAKAGLLRCGKSCRLRWMNYLRPGIKRGNITPEEADLIIQLQSLHGNRWSLIAQSLPGRTDNDIKNHWNTHLHNRKQLLLKTSSGSFDQQQQLVCHENKIKRTQKSKRIRNKSTTTTTATTTAVTTDHNALTSDQSSSGSITAITTDGNAVTGDQSSISSITTAITTDHTAITGGQLSSTTTASTTSSSNEGLWAFLELDQYSSEGWVEVCDHQDGDSLTISGSTDHLSFHNNDSLPIDDHDNKFGMLYNEYLQLLSQDSRDHS